MKQDYLFIEKMLSSTNDEQCYFFNELLLSDPIEMRSEYREKRINNYTTILNFYLALKDLFKKLLFSNEEPDLLNLLLNDSQEKLPLNFHKNLPECAWTIPIFFRTDESYNAKIFEIQNPGSGWADPIILYRFYKEYKNSTFLNSMNPRDIHALFIKDVIKITGCEQPSIMHMLDSSSNPSMMRYFIALTSNPLKYWGFNPQVSNSNIQFVRGHSVYSIINENLFNFRLKQVDLGATVFDLPPLIIFDQKLVYSLPFFKQTCHLFSDEIRDALVYTTIVFPNGFWDINGEFVSIDDFLKRPPKLRKYYLKYGGCDTSLNWGSRAVFRLDSKMASQQLQQATEDFRRNRPWIIQPALGEKEDIEYCSREEESNLFKRFPAKYSTFYGPSGLYAVRSHHRQSTKVHGQPDAVVGLAY